MDYDVSMQLLRYMMCIWVEHRREMEKAKEGCTRQKGFRYPVIIPIIYYEGKERWTADMHLSDRIRDGGEFRKWTPDFQYEVVRLHDYSDQELLNRGDEMSLIMLINKIQKTEDLEHFIQIPADQMNRIIQDSPQHVVDAIASVMESLCFKMDVSKEERMQCVQKVKERNMGYLFENIEKFSIQEERRKTEEQRVRADEEHKRAEEEHMRAEEQTKRAEEQAQKAEEEHRRAEEEHRKAEEQRIKVEEIEEKLRRTEEMLKQLEGF